MFNTLLSNYHQKALLIFESSSSFFPLTPLLNHQLSSPPFLITAFVMFGGGSPPSFVLVLGDCVYVCVSVRICVV